MQAYGAAKRAELVSNPGIIRNRLKVDAFVDNARAFLRILEGGESFDAFIWQFTDGKSLRRRPLRLKNIQASSAHSDAMSKELKRRGFRFVGTTICHAYMQAVGMIDEHQRACWRSTGGAVHRQKTYRRAEKCGAE
jgi:DNA-3-methyladenine glycosylase I